MRAIWALLLLKALISEHGIAALPISPIKVDVGNNWGGVDLLLSNVQLKGVCQASSSKGQGETFSIIYLQHIALFFQAPFRTNALVSKQICQAGSFDSKETAIVSCLYQRLHDINAAPFCTSTHFHTLLHPALWDSRRGCILSLCSLL